MDKAVELNHVGGTFGGAQQPCPFLCLIAKMLQIQPEKDIIIEFIKNEDYKYVRLLGVAFSGRRNSCKVQFRCLLFEVDWERS